MHTQPQRQALKENRARAASTKPTSYLEMLALSLIHYAEQDAAFAKELAAHAAALAPSRYGSAPNAPELAGYPLEILTPRDAVAAERRAEWLVAQISDPSLRGSREARSLLADWIRDNPSEQPKQIVVGFVVVAIPGITAGKFSRRANMNYVLRKDLANKKQGELGQHLTNASLDILSRALTRSGGKIHRIEPEMGDWFFGDRSMSLYAAENSAMAAIERDMRRVHALCGKASDNKGPAVLAISPAVNTAYQETEWDIEPLEK